ncbi:MAG: Ribonuclease H [Parcubacteria group bacterium GW2011_GWC1_42_11]|uniref:ribonuclease H n=1 Tax=Candidatus Nomurabacteria bacterium GW2011_GWC2_42_20 TaxID=1618756 RepID=A0A0G0ZHR3_9BACT|nr:MAG: Ribonuclease H [Parcubacteria group bacterium GW2011_GWC1_42_11]KKS48194.1 MAG: Ribonuclease H [Candidatus Nomurabacteria bacterium GW2011_GWC2_42_20]KKS58558.1 MAG: Ribonuclease H [Candidatus Nomurabacteria bacterium GW2011_GWA2_42_41]KKT09769.1 MAG: Ribonuclease H [Candidatus Nomurabacteria bacterium GW2011_GWB1_43_20]TAN36822.1 MAG: ribonuclease HI [Patescibacteria group bacterium]HBH71775.1 ribonuclease HI [Candidatus Yonathbacteria bacterium]
MKSPDIIIYTDGSSRGNPGPGGWGAIVATSERVVELGAGNRHTTNNKMELSAAISALSYVRDLGGEYTIDMHVDSQYVINGITKWVAGWERNGWINSKKEEVLNRDLWEPLAEVVADLQMSGCKISWHYTPGHAGIEGNDRADIIATTFADDEKPELFNGDRSEYDVDLVPHAGDPKLLALKKSKSNLKNGVKAYSYLSLVNGNLEKHTTWAECEKRVKGVKGVKFKKSVSADDEKIIMKSWGL